VAEGDALDAAAIRAFGIFDIARRALWIPYIAVAYFPIHAATPIAQALAGKHTSVTASFSFTAVATLTLTGSGVLIWRNRVLANDNKRLRGRVTELEGQLPD